jgi:hypothetical protein
VPRPASTGRGAVHNRTSSSDTRNVQPLPPTPVPLAGSRTTTRSGRTRARWSENSADARLR